jgi:hypothetical protein
MWSKKWSTFLWTVTGVMLPMDLQILNFSSYKYLLFFYDFSLFGALAIFKYKVSNHELW